MGYPNFGKVKTIVLPLIATPDGGITIEEYKKATGIDLSDFFQLRSEEIHFVADAHILGCVTKSFMENYGYYYEGTNYVPMTDCARETYEEGATDGELSIVFDNAFGGLETNGGIRFVISKDLPFALENIRIHCAEI